MSDFNGKPWGNTDEEGDTAYVGVKAVTATATAAGAWLIGDGARDTLDVDGIGRQIRDGADPRPSALTVKLKVDGDALPTAVNVAKRIEDGRASAWWEFDNPYDLTKDLVSPDWEAKITAAREAREQEARRRARTDRGPWWWRLRADWGQRLARIAMRVEPDDVSSVHYTEGESLVIARVRGPRGRRVPHALRNRQPF